MKAFILGALVGASCLAATAGAQGPERSQGAPTAPAIPIPEAQPLGPPSQLPLRPSSQRIETTPSGPMTAPASTQISPPSQGAPRPAAEGATPTAIAPRPSGQVTIDSDLQQADQATGIITATGNVRIVYPDQRVVATSRQAQYFTKEDRVVLSGDVDVIQEGGNHLRAERVIYLIKADRVIAEPAAGQQVFSRMVIQQKSAPSAAKASPSTERRPAPAVAP